MARPEPVNMTDARTQKQLDYGIREMISSLTRRLSDLHGNRGGHDQPLSADDELGVRVVTLAGTNTGASMRGELDDKSSLQLGGGEGEEEEVPGTYVNSNFQSINNSIMLAGNYSANNPGVHLNISEEVEPQHGQMKHPHKANKGHKKDKDSSKSDQYYSQTSD
ncbi:uncharacterized protein LOC127787574 [Diospyros lotus]|uniref:uncharacterized protein LOC127787574 n=1 Tax=Diospyros lotus TaxID=55363 RepID=UPI002258044E|nr:uncharacterized protein LOC127787574 [Diospyros lotus]